MPISAHAQKELIQVSSRGNRQLFYFYGGHHFWSSYGAQAHSNIGFVAHFLTSFLSSSSSLSSPPPPVFPSNIPPKFHSNTGSNWMQWLRPHRRTLYRRAATIRSPAAAQVLSWAATSVSTRKSARAALVSFSLASLDSMLIWKAF